MSDKKPLEKRIFENPESTKMNRTTSRSLDWDLMYNQCNADSMLHLFISLLTGAMKNHAPFKKSIYP